MLRIFLFLIISQNAYSSSFNQSKKILYKKIFNNRGETLYCDCQWKNKKVDLKSCGLQSYFTKKERKRSLRTEAEHVIPASWLLKVHKKLRQCAVDATLLKKNKRKYCLKHDKSYKKAHNDLINLWPTVGQINADRSNKPFVDGIKKVIDNYGKCEAASGSRGFAPPNNRKGDIARIAFYMSKKYGVTYSRRQLRLFLEWDKLDPISSEEIEHHNKIYNIQGYGLFTFTN
ncbi:endonuclease [Aliikangiella sp. IMCC44359]|uniref:endonuclease n=1 Tax=Aliikangiella sp. IMCC44359 TaxID=3459125 RepID=UPI00403AFDBC